VPRTRNQDVEIYYETHGERQGRPLVLVMGLGAQLIHWPEPFIERLVASGHFVVTFDNRDVGFSTSFAAAGKVDFRAFLTARAKGEPYGLPYQMSEMADDTLGLMDALELRSAHFVGMSMGGRVAQLVAIAQPERVRSLTCVMSTTGGPNLPQTYPEVMARLFAPPVTAPEERIQRAVEMHQAICVNPHDFNAERARQKAVAAQQRGLDPFATGRQMAALLAAGDSEPALRRLRIPALVMHGALDPLLPVGHGRRTHECLQDSELWIEEQLGHYLADRVQEGLADRIDALTARADARGAAIRLRSPA
jgi:pimeloyl-ACP methyl ester carboxylesterase